MLAIEDVWPFTEASIPTVSRLDTLYAAVAITAITITMTHEPSTNLPDMRNCRPLLLWRGIALVDEHVGEIGKYGLSAECTGIPWYVRFCIEDGY